jgi:hypothetical protein
MSDEKTAEGSSSRTVQISTRAMESRARVMIFAISRPPLTERREQAGYFMPDINPRAMVYGDLP